MSPNSPGVPSSKSGTGLLNACAALSEGWRPKILIDEVLEFLNTGEKSHDKYLQGHAVHGYRRQKKKPKKKRKKKERKEQRRNQQHSQVAHSILLVAYCSERATRVSSAHPSLCRWCRDNLPVLVPKERKVIKTLPATWRLRLQYATFPSCCIQHRQW